MSSRLTDLDACLQRAIYGATLDFGPPFGTVADGTTEVTVPHAAADRIVYCTYPQFGRRNAARSQEIEASPSSDLTSAKKSGSGRTR